MGDFEHFKVVRVFFSPWGHDPACSALRLVDAKDGETAGALMTFFLALGLSLGAALSFLLRALV